MAGWSKSERRCGSRPWWAWAEPRRRGARPPRFEAHFPHSVLLPAVSQMSRFRPVIAPERIRWIRAPARDRSGGGGMWRNARRRSRRAARPFCPSTSATRSSSSTTGGATTGWVNTRCCSRTAAGPPLAGIIASPEHLLARRERQRRRLAQPGDGRAVERPAGHPRRHGEPGRPARETGQRPDRFDDAQSFRRCATDRRACPAG